MAEIHTGNGDNYYTLRSSVPGYNLSGSNTVYLEDGNDSFFVLSMRNDTIYGGNGDDQFSDGEGKNYIDGGAGNDTFVFWGSIDEFTVVPQGNNEYLVTDVAWLNKTGILRQTVLTNVEYVRPYLTPSGSTGGTAITIEQAVQQAGKGASTSSATPTATEGNDTLNGTANADLFEGRGGNDSISGGAGNDTLQGNQGDDIVIGGLGNDSMRGGKGNDYLEGQGDNDMIFGDLGDDVLDGGAGDDRLEAGTSHVIDGPGDNDTVFGGDGNDFISGNIGADAIAGENGNDTIQGGKGNDVIYGDAGNDILAGDRGDDYLFGGSGNDTFIFRSESGIDVIADFQQGDVLQIQTNINGTGVSNFSQLSIFVVEGSVAINLGNGYGVGLYGVPLSAFDASDVAFI